MIRCINEEKETLYASNCEESLTRKLSKEKKLYCPNCMINVIFKKGKVMSAHFAHRDSDCVVNHSEPETNSHIKGKEILYDWIKEKYPTAFVEYEYPISETGQIADVYVKHTEGEMKDIRWAFEFQHSPLSSADWETRHNLYESAGIQDFWILDKARFMKFSTAQGITDARLRKDLESTIFSKVGVCYFLDLESKVMTIDFKFITSWDTKIVKGIERKTEYTYHHPIQHSFHIDGVRMRMNDEFKHGVLVFDKVEEQMEPTLSSILSSLRHKLEEKLEQQLQDQAKKKKTYAETNYESQDADIIWDFMKRNKEHIKDDVRNLSETNFFKKYSNYIDTAISNNKELDLLEKSDDLVQKSLRGFISFTDVNKMTFLNKQSDKSLEEYLKLEYKDKIALIEYVYNTHRKVLDKLASSNQRHIKSKLETINSWLITYEKNPTAIDYAIRYRRCENIEEIDKYVEQIREEIIDYDPFVDFDLW
ncbi:competence protein CoiA family protein [Priestia megaterium]|uniref:competence protein CoiA n=1 Tax=Priestia megaterium TaxID=1404 RepID=UPI00234F8FBE|nr:competence protein CoiA family protein [Priestia megaterium]MDC7770353.1 competence protein CoiA family protein [Priestia megaterium]